MSILKIMEWPAKVLSVRSTEVKEFDDDLREFVANMHETMEKSGGIGLAANQVNDTRRIVAIKIPWGESDDGNDSEKEEKCPWHDKAYTFINPKVIKKVGKVRWQEGCLSFPEIFEYIERAEEVYVEAMDEFGHPFDVKADGLFAICLQHEIDHIDGIVFIDRMSRLKAQMVIKRILKRQQLQDGGIEDGDVAHKPEAEDE